MPIPPVLAGMLGTPELIVILCLALLFFGASKMPGIARSLGRSVNEFKAGMKDEPEPQKKPAAPAATPSDSGAQKN
jgi:sec-independent protein translocase protein TatA